jgi:hypothetical protein
VISTPDAIFHGERGDHRIPQGPRQLPARRNEHFVIAARVRRAFVVAWAGIPLAKPSAAVIAANAKATVYASWNGSTQTTAWKLLAGRARKSLSPVSITPRTGFETAIATTAAGLFDEVKALDASGGVLKTSAVIRAHGPG